MEESKERLNIHNYTQIFRRRRWFFIIPLIVVYAAFLASSYFLPKIYEAKAVILVEEKTIVNPLLKNLAVSTSAADRLNGLREEILAWPRLFQLVEKLGLNKKIDSPLELEKLISDIRRDVIVRMKSREVIVIAYQGKNPKNTQKLVNTLCDILIERNISSQSEGTESAINFIKSQLAVYKGKLNESQEELRKFREIYGLGMLTEQKVPSNSEGGAVVPEADSSAGVVLSQISQEIAQREADLVIASVDDTDEHPRVKWLKRRIKSLKEKRRQYVREVAERTGVEPASYVDIVDSLPRQQEELIRLTRDNRINEQTYAMLLERLQTAKITESLDNSENKTKFRIIEPARMPLKPSKPNKMQLNFLGLILGGTLGCGLIYILEYADNSFKNADELSKLFSLPVLGNISKIVTEEDLRKQAKSARRKVLLAFSITILVILAVIIITKLIS